MKCKTLLTLAAAITMTVSSSAAVFAADSSQAIEIQSSEIQDQSEIETLSETEEHVHAWSDPVYVIDQEAQYTQIKVVDKEAVWECVTIVDKEAWDEEKPIVKQVCNGCGAQFDTAREAGLHILAAFGDKCQNYTSKIVGYETIHHPEESHQECKEISPEEFHMENVMISPEKGHWEHTCTNPGCPIGTENCPAPEEPDYIPGDVDDNGSVEISDLRLVLRYICGKVTLTDSQMLAADVGKDGEVNITDLRQILRFVCHKIDSFDV